MSHSTEAAHNRSIGEGRAGPGSEASIAEGDFAPVHAECFIPIPGVTCTLPG